MPSPDPHPGNRGFHDGRHRQHPSGAGPHLAHNKVLHAQVVLLTIVTEEVPHVSPMERVQVTTLGDGFYRVTAHYGFMQDPDVLEVLASCGTAGLHLRLAATTFFLGRETLIATERRDMAIWRENLFSFMSRNALRATAFFRLPPDQVFEVGAQVEL